MDISPLRKRLRKAIQTSGLSQRKFCIEHGLSLSVTNKFLTGQLANPRLKTIQHFEDLLAKVS